MTEPKTDSEPRCPSCGGAIKAMSRRLAPALIVLTGICQNCQSVWHFNYELSSVEKERT